MFLKGSVQEPLVASLLLVAMPGAPSSFLFERPGAPSKHFFDHGPTEGSSAGAPDMGIGLKSGPCGTNHSPGTETPVLLYRQVSVRHEHQHEYH